MYIKKRAVIINKGSYSTDSHGMSEVNAVLIEVTRNDAVFREQRHFSHWQDTAFH
jgi:hypothetical protein